MTANRKFLVTAIAFFGFVIAFGVLTAPQDPQRDVTEGSTLSGYSHDELQADADMTQRMSTANASGPMQSGRITDPQLEHSQNPGFVDALEQHQADIDRMLGRGTP